MIKAIFFDFNGVIIDDEIIQMKAYQELLQAHEIALTEDLYFGALGMDDKTFVRAMFQQAGKPLSEPLLESILTDKSEMHRQMIADLPLFPGVVTFLKAAARQFSVGLVSMANKIEVGNVFERGNLTPYFSVVVTAEDAKECKPAPDCYLTGLAKLNEQRQRERKLPLLATECLAVEDSPPGIQSAGAAGMHTLGVTNTVEAAALREAGAEIVTASLADWNVDAVMRLY